MGYGVESDGRGVRKERLEGTRPATNEEEFEAKKIEWGVGSGADRGALSVVGVFEQSKVPFKQALDPFAMILSHKVGERKKNRRWAPNRVFMCSGTNTFFDV